MTGKPLWAVEQERTELSAQSKAVSMIIHCFGRWYSTVVWLASAGHFIAVAMLDSSMPVLSGFLVLLLFGLFFLSPIALLLGFDQAYAIDPKLTFKQFRSLVVKNVSVNFILFGVTGALIQLVIVAAICRGPSITPAIVDGKYVDAPHGRVVREVTESEYLNARHEERQMSASLALMFSWFGVCFFRWSRFESVIPPPREGS